MTTYVLCVALKFLFVAGEMIFLLMSNFIHLLLNIISENTHHSGNIKNRLGKKKKWF